MSDPELPYSHFDIDGRTFYHGTKADLKIGDMLQGGYSSNYTERRSPWIYFSETVFAATWGVELARGEGPGRICVITTVLENLYMLWTPKATRFNYGSLLTAKAATNTCFAFYGRLRENQSL